MAVHHQGRRSACRSQACRLHHAECQRRAPCAISHRKDHEQAHGRQEETQLARSNHKMGKREILADAKRVLRQRDRNSGAQQCSGDPHTKQESANLQHVGRIGSAARQHRGQILEDVKLKRRVDQCRQPSQSYDWKYAPQQKPIGTRNAFTDGDLLHYGPPTRLCAIVAGQHVMHVTATTAVPAPPRRKCRFSKQWQELARQERPPPKQKTPHPEL